MIRRLRVRHRFLVTGLAVVVPVVFALGMAVRGDTPASDLPDVLRPPTVPGNAVEVEIAGVRFAAWRSDTTLLLVTLRTAPPFATDDPRFGADVLVYWSPEGAGMDHEETVLLGRFAGNELVEFAPPSAGGTLTFYSNAYRSVIGSGPIPDID